MIKFFRKIRQQLLTENKFSKYLIYAIGEIILVVIGILIALSINNWNTKENEKELEIKYLNQIKSSLEISEQSIKASIVKNKSILKEGEFLLDHLKNNKPLNDTILKLFIIPQFDQSIRLSTAAFENLKNEGLSLISNDRLKITIIDIYEQEITLIQSTFANQIENYNTSIVGPFYNKNFEVDTKGNVPSFIPNNYEELLANREMTNLLSTVNGLRLYSIAFYELALEKIRQILLEIKDEIRRLE